MSIEMTAKNFHSQNHTNWKYHIPEITNNDQGNITNVEDMKSHLFQEYQKGYDDGKKCSLEEQQQQHSTLLSEIQTELDKIETEVALEIKQLQQLYFQHFCGMINDLLPYLHVTQDLVKKILQNYNIDVKIIQSLRINYPCSTKEMIVNNRKIPIEATTGEESLIIVLDTGELVLSNKKLLNTITSIMEQHVKR